MSYNRNKTEIFWGIAALTLSLFLASFIFGFRSLFSWTTDINVYDTFLVTDSINGFILILTLLTFLIYLVRAIKTKFNNQIVNYILLFANGYLIYLSKMVVLIGIMISSVLQRDGESNGQGWSIEPPYSANTDSIDDNSSIVVIIQLALIIIFGYIAYRTGANKNKRRS
ncbi:hypothetical protein [Maribacter aestuarii]|uniref:hypothetical protein n=1 Tax=Maribacter aestuarii TaxID=1130723 RepID=UPI00248C2573|nr:hypothetical protein [Maribacter aestuarii]